jgi:hypothetical protein
MVLSFYYGLSCLGGFNQINYLTDMQTAYLQLQDQLGQPDNKAMAQAAYTRHMNDGFTLAFLQTSAGKTVPATGLDLALYGDQTTWPNLLATMKTMTVAEGFDPLLPELYRVIYSEEERVADLTAISESDITKITDLERKIKPAAVVQ